MRLRDELRQDDDGTHDLEKDFYMGTATLFLLLVGGTRLPEAEATASGEGRAPGIVQELFLTEDECLHADRHDAPTLAQGELVDLLSVESDPRTGVLLRFAPDVPGERIFEVLSAVQRTTGKGARVRVFNEPTGEDPR